jgi:hypothetical protein
MEPSVEFNNASEHIFTDISSEEWRAYTTPAVNVFIHFPLKLHVSANGHRVFSADGICHYIGTRHGFYLTWKPKAGQPHFVK